MSESKPNSNLLFENWLAIATKGLCDPAVVRIREETEGHFAAAFDDALHSGMTADQAALHAVALLGNAHAARRAFRRQHLTKFEHEQVVQELHRFRPLRRFVGMFQIWSFLAYFGAIQLPHIARWFWIATLASGLLWIMMTFPSRWNEIAAKQPKSILILDGLMTIFEWLAGAALVIMTWLNNSPIWAAFFVVGTYLSGRITISYSSAIYKVVRYASPTSGPSQ